MHDPRNKKLADIFLDHSLKIKKNDKLVIMTSDLQPMDLIRECMKGALQRGALIYLDIMGFNFLLDRTSAGDLVKTFYDCADEYQIQNYPKIHDAVVDWGDKFIRISSYENEKHLASVCDQKMSLKRKSFQKVFYKMIDKKWVLTSYPTNSFAQLAEMSLYELYDFYFKAVLVDYKKMEKQQKKLARIIDKGKNVRIVGNKTDITFGIKGRTACICAGEYNIPDGEVFTGPEENKTQGHIYYEFPQSFIGKFMSGIYLEFKDGKVIKYSAETGQNNLKHLLDTDPGAKRLGELAIGANYGIKRFMNNALFDEKIGGTIHTALGSSFLNEKRGWGKNKSAIHWDIVKDTRLKGSKVWVDNKLILKDGKILV